MLTSSTPPLTKIFPVKALLALLSTNLPAPVLVRLVTVALPTMAEIVSVSYALSVRTMISELASPTKVPAPLIVAE